MAEVSPIFFSVVIPALNEERYLPLLLRDLARQSFFLDHLEVIVVDGNSEDSTREKANSFADNFGNLQVIISPVRHVSYQRNLGAAKAQGEWIIFMDADDRLPANFLDDLRVEIIRNPNYQLFTTWALPDRDNSATSIITQLANYGTDFFQFMGKPAAMGAMIIAHRSVAQHVHFDESQHFMEDAQFIQHGCDAGYNFKILHEPRYVFSLRRMRKEGSLKLLSAVARMQLDYIKGKGFQEKVDKYPMLGGGYYDGSGTSFFSQLFSLVKSASQSQLKQWIGFFRP